MPKLTEKKLQSWNRRAIALDKAAKKLMDSMMATLGAEDEATDGIDNVTDATEELCHILSQPNLKMWHLK